MDRLLLGGVMTLPEFSGEGGKGRGGVGHERVHPSIRRLRLGSIMALAEFSGEGWKGAECLN